MGKLRKTVVIAALVLLGVLGLFWVREPLTEASLAPAEAVAVSANVVSSAAPVSEPCPDLAVADELLAVTRAEIEGRSEAFPPDPAPGVSAAEFLADLDALKRACPGVSVDHVDCEEYPCLAWVSATPWCDAKNDFLTFDLRSAIGLPNGEIAAWDMLYRMQPNERLHSMRVFDINRFNRTETRRRSAHAALEVTTGGSPLSEVERAATDAEITRAQLEMMEPDDPRYEAIQRKLDDAERRITSARFAGRRGASPAVPVSVPARGPAEQPTSCAAAVAERVAEIEALRTAAYGDPVPFPADLEWYLQPEAVEARARRVMTECPELGWTLHEVDCSEYPCITFWDHARSNEERVRLWDCPAWSEVRTKGEAMGASIFTDPDGIEREILAVAQYSPRSDDSWQSVPAGGRASRFELRTQPTLDDLQQMIRAR